MALASSAGPAGFGGGEGVVCTGTAVQADSPVVCTQEKKEGEKDPSFLPSREAVAIQTVLLQFGVYVLSRPHREALSERLAIAGMTAADLQALHDYLSRYGEPDKVQRTYAAKVIDVQGLTTAIADLRKHLSGPLGAAARKWAPGEMDRQRNRLTLEQERRQWEEADREHFVRCMGRDGIPREVALAEWHAARGRE